MDCSACSKLEDYICSGFPTESDYLKLDELIELLESLNQIKYTSNFIYACNLCDAKWEIDIPDLTYRGGFKRI